MSHWGVHWDIPWTTDEVINFAFLAVSCVIVTAVPLIYGFKANFRDELARAVIAGTGATAIAFDVSLAVTVAYHAGWNPEPAVWNWIARFLYTAVSLGKLLLLVALLRVLRGEPKHSKRVRNHHGNEDQHSGRS